jgi:hypothetical protein
MSRHLAVYVGRTPDSHEAAAREVRRLRQVYLEDLVDAPLHHEVEQFFTAAIARFPDWSSDDEARVDEMVWSGGPVRGCASGPIMVFGIREDFVDQAVPFLIELATKCQLLAFDVAEEQLVNATPYPAD